MPNAPGLVQALTNEYQKWLDTMNEALDDGSFVEMADSEKAAEDLRTVLKEYPEVAESIFRSGWLRLVVYLGER